MPAKDNRNMGQEKPAFSDDLKRAVVQAVVPEFPASGSLAMGTGSTVAALLNAVAASPRFAERAPGYRVVSTSLDTTVRCNELNLAVVSIWPAHLPIGFDGADLVAVDENAKVLCAVKGGGGAHDIEKQVASLVAGGIILMIDHAKLMPRGERTDRIVKVPISIAPPAVNAALEALPAALQIAPGKLQIRHNPPGGIFGISVDGPSNVVLDAHLSVDEFFARYEAFDDLLKFPWVKAHGVFSAELIRSVYVAHVNGKVTTVKP